MTDHTTPLLRDALARAMHGHFHREYDWPMEECGYHGNGHRMDADAILHALANDPEVMAAVALALDGSFFSYPSRSSRRNARDVLVATLFGEPDD